MAKQSVLKIMAQLLEEQELTEWQELTPEETERLRGGQTTPPNTNCWNTGCPAGSGNNRSCPL